MDQKTAVLTLAVLVAACPAVLMSQPAEFDKMSLWSSDTVELRGANIYQRRVYPALDGTEFLGPGPFGPPYTPQDFDRLAALGANYVNISTSGIYSEDKPYALSGSSIPPTSRSSSRCSTADRSTTPSGCFMVLYRT